MKELIRNVAPEVYSKSHQLLVMFSTGHNRDGSSLMMQCTDYYITTAYLRNAGNCIHSLEVSSGTWHTLFNPSSWLCCLCSPAAAVKNFPASAAKLFSLPAVFISPSQHSFGPHVVFYVIYNEQTLM